jgi:hypothetical protein
LEHLATSFSAEEGAALLQWAGITIRPGFRSQPVEAGSAEAATQDRHDESMARNGRWAAYAKQPPWLASLLQLAGVSLQEGTPRTRGAEQGVAVVQPAPHARHSRISDSPAALGLDPLADSTRAPGPVEGHPPRSRQDEGLKARRAVPTRSSAADDFSGTEPPANAERVADRQAAPAWLAPTACGGLPFLLPVLQSLGLPQWCDDERVCAAMARRIFAAALTRLRVPAEDVGWALTRSPVDLPVFTGRAAPAIWSDASLRAPRSQPRIALPQALQMASTADQQAQFWLTAVRRWLRRRGGIGLSSLVLRPARLDCTATHLDMHFYVNDVDMRVRRVGLDIDPGWLPWFGQVVTYHYMERGV